MKTRFNRWHFPLLISSSIGLAVPIAILYHSEDAGFVLVLALFGGYAFMERPLVIGGALDQCSLHKELFLFCYSLVVTFPCIALVGWISKRGSRLVQRIFATLSTIILVHPFSALTIFAYDMSRYIYQMGSTPRRWVGLIIALIGYGVLSFFTIWVWRLKVEKTQAVDRGREGA
ncbi:hypothetical protein Ga0100231_004220 [Opitutaceae bacterium TAV4]|nr:hypothetical protein Ga0100231_004220 [Opitutaceae bacterium TAV4]RRK02236.1 hypothetical protein Ga0100230_003405 [Opitutaceae bacterium TAV3]